MQFGGETEMVLDSDGEGFSERPVTTAGKQPFLVGAVPLLVCWQSRCDCVVSAEPGFDSDKFDLECQVQRLAQGENRLPRCVFGVGL